MIRCSNCAGHGQITAAGKTCPVCGGDGVEPDSREAPARAYSDADALRDLQESILQSTTISDFMAVKKTVEAIREAEND